MFSDFSGGDDSTQNNSPAANADSQEHKLYVGNLPYEFVADDLRELFSEAGQVVDAVVISERHSGRSKGFGFVKMNSDEEAQKAIELFDQKEVESNRGPRKLVVNKAQPRKPRESFGGGRGGYNRGGYNRGSSYNRGGYNNRDDNSYGNSY